MKTYWNPYKRKTESKTEPPAEVEKVDEPAKPTRAKKARKSK